MMALQSKPRTCRQGHVLVHVSNNGVSRWMCPVCLGAALETVRRRASQMTVNDYLARYEMGEIPSLPAAEAGYATAFLKAVQ